LQNKAGILSGSGSELDCVEDGGPSEVYERESTREARRDIVNRGAGKNRRRKERFFRSEVRAGKGVGTLYPCSLSCDYCASVVDNASCWETRSSLLTLQLSSCE